MSTIEQLISDLLLRHSCVIVPSFGGFVAKQASAVIDYSNGVIQPPKKSLLFNRQLINNDGLLISELANQNKISFEKAQEEVAQKIDTWKAALQHGERIVLDRVGYLFYDQERNICFEQDRFFNLLLESYGLGKVHFLTESDVAMIEHKVQATERILVEESTEEKRLDFKPSSIEVHTDRPTERKSVVIDHPEKVSRKFSWKYAAAVAVIPIAFYSYWLPMKTKVLESGILSSKDFNPFYKSTEGSYKVNEWGKLQMDFPQQESLEDLVARLPNDVRVFSYKFDDDLYMPVRIPEKKEEPIRTEVKTTPVETINNVVARGNFDYIVGCFTSSENAENLIATLKSKGFKAYQVDIKNGLYRVSAGNASSQENLQLIVSNATSAGLEGWVLKK